MAGRAGASQDAPVSCNAGKANPVRFRPHEISLSSGGHNKPLQETPCDLLDLLSAPFNATTDFTVLADYCARFAETLIETDDPALRLALCGRLHAALALLQPTLHDPIPPHLIESLTVDTLPATPEHFISEPDSLCEYCLALLQLLLERPAEPKTEQTLTGLLCELVWNFTEGLKSPRWLRTADGVKFISEVAA